MAGKLVVLEGVDGSGKTSVWNGLRERAAARELDFVWGRDPGDTSVGQRLRAILLDPGTVDLAPAAELLLYLASRAQLVHERVAPALAAGKTVVLDRYWLSTLAYQGAAGAETPERLRDLVGVGIGAARYPDAVLWLELPVEESWRRVHGRDGVAVDRLEARGLDYLRAVRDRYEDELARLPATVAVHRLDATQSPETVADQAFAALMSVRRDIAAC